MLLSDFISKLQAIESGSAGTHHYDGKVEVEFYLDDDKDELDIDIELQEVAPITMMGCGCWAGATVWLRVKRK